MKTILLIIYLLFSRNILCRGLFHSLQDSHTAHEEWNTPGFWRPKWIMDREFYNSRKKVIKRDRIIFKMMNDESIHIFRHKNRPKLHILQPHLHAKSKSEFEVANKSVEIEATVKNAKRKKTGGAWEWELFVRPERRGLVTIEVQDDHALPTPGERTKHEVICDFGKMDSYAAIFRPGFIKKYTFTLGFPTGEERIGSFTIKVNPHRPLISKEYIAFR